MPGRPTTFRVVVTSSTEPDRRRYQRKSAVTKLRRSPFYRINRNFCGNDRPRSFPLFVKNGGGKKGRRERRETAERLVDERRGAKELITNALDNNAVWHLL